MTFESLCDHLVRRCGVGTAATLRAKVLSASIDPLTLNWLCVDDALLSSVSAVTQQRDKVFHLDLMRTNLGDGRV